MIFGQAFTGLMLFIIAADFSSIDGDWAARLGIPGASFARISFLFIPLAALLPCVLPRRMTTRARILCSDFLMFGLLIFPIILFTIGSRGVRFSGEFPSGLERELGFPVVLVSDGNGSHVYFPRTRDPALVSDALRRRGYHPSTE